MASVLSTNVVPLPRARWMFRKKITTSHKRNFSKHIDTLSISHQKNALYHLAKELNIQTYEDWYTVPTGMLSILYLTVLCTFKDTVKQRGGDLLRPYNGSLPAGSTKDCDLTSFSFIITFT
jgi:hypothetical protein